ncbi:ribonuclease III [Candidatus Marithrix sp. Canyon 246]|uniref:ribonuclease III n=1 Tax=Candidatus Marithrix sp. Canyon 246 TaxID=1827136 RepID=UPI000849F0BA|nr:ribonuclease III [Candidatus Marithrix sp. Canyon 246]
MANQDYSGLYQALNYKFEDENNLITALTHRSVGMPNNERLEFLGDALLSCVIAEVLFERFPSAREGQLTRFRANLVKRDTLVTIAQQLNLSQYLRLGSGEVKSGGEHRASILADAVEAILGAIYLDGDIHKCQAVLLQLWEGQIKNLSAQQIKDPKTCLQEYLQAQQQPLPDYRILEVKGSPHNQLFEIECIVPCLKESSYGSGKSRRRAEQSAAAQALSMLNVE